MNSIDLNCDMGEGMPDDAAIIPFISSANIACGYHAGDRDTMRRTVDLCMKHSVAVGAHPGFRDRENFGRIPVQLSSAELYELINEQLHELNAICKEMHTALHHVKPHGALYNMAARDEQMSATIAKAVKDLNPNLIYYGLSGSCMISEAKKLGLTTSNEVFADRTYQNDGSLTPRSNPDALIHDENSMLEQVVRFVREAKVETTEKQLIPVKADTICIHGDGKFAVKFAKAIHEKLQREGIKIESIRTSK